eukprot:CCRYP_011421-RE/>CCRYP_011421-RE protein AED:0.07 eAED:0.07 QI:2864/0.75/1/1/1/0.8/5/561/500
MDLENVSKPLSTAAIIRPQNPKTEKLFAKKIVFVFPECAACSEKMVNEVERTPSSNDGGDAKYNADKIISESFARLSEIQASSAERVTKSFAHAQQREEKRRDDEVSDNLKRSALVDQIEQIEEGDAVATGWKECMSATNAQDLCDFLNNQKALCEGVISKLESISKDLGSQLRQKDHEYVTALKTNRHEIGMLQSCIEKEHYILKNAFEKELKLIEDSLNADKAKLLQERKGELDALMTERNEVELRCLVHHREMINKQRADIQACEASGDRETFAVKEELEQELRRLEIELEDTKARHRFESNKLEFDVRVLDELSDNNVEITKQKKRIIKGKEKLYMSKESKKREHERGAKENRILEESCERIERQCNGLKEKFERFKMTDSEKFRSVLAMHKDDLQKLQNELDRSQDFIFGGEIGCYGDKFDKWQQAEELMSNYKDILEQREVLHSEVKRLEEKNNDLEKELQERLNEKVNEELAFPPSNDITMNDNDKKEKKHHE